MTRQVATSPNNDLLLLKGHRLIVKLGGEIMLNRGGLDSIASQIAQIAACGGEVVVVHGGGPQADALAERLGHKVRKVEGRRITDDDALDVAKMVFAGSINVDLLGSLKRHGVRGVGLSGVDSDLITVTRRPPVRVADPGIGPGIGIERWVDFGHVGDVASVDISLLEMLLRGGYVSVVASLAADSEGRIYNVNADTIAQSLAVALGASRLVLMTNVPGILLDAADASSLVPLSDVRGLAALVESGAITGGMLPKVHNCIQAIQAGVQQVLILDGTQNRPPLLESLTRGGVGTTVTA